MIDGANSLQAMRNALTHHEQMLDAQDGCVACKLCGGKAVVSDAGPGAGYYVRCENSEGFRKSNGCLLSNRRLSGWAYNVMDWWNRLHFTAPPIVGDLPAIMPGHWSTPGGRQMALTSLDCPHMARWRERTPDLQLANEVFLSPGIGNLTDAKERIRWLSAQLAVRILRQP